MGFQTIDECIARMKAARHKLSNKAWWESTKLSFIEVSPEQTSRAMALEHPIASNGTGSVRTTIFWQFLCTLSCIPANHPTLTL
jgi:hypothetical protein